MAFLRREKNLKENEYKCLHMKEEKSRKHCETGESATQYDGTELT